MKKLKFNPFIVPAFIALIGISKYSLDTYNAKKVEVGYKNEFTSKDISKDITSTNIIDGEFDENINVTIDDKSSELLDDGYVFENIDFDKLNSFNEDVVGWISIDDVINEYPIVQGDDNEKYLHTDLYGNYSKCGNPFMDYTDDSSLSSDLTVIYGHHMKDGTGFAGICNYKDSTYIENHPYGVYYDEDGAVYIVKFFAGVIVNANDINYLNVEDMDEISYNEFVSSIEQESTFNTDLDVEYGDDLLALVTCSYETNNSRYILYGKLEKQYKDYKELKR